MDFATADEHTKGGRALTSDYESIRLETKRRKWEKGTWGNDDAIGQVMLSFNGKVVVEDKALRNALNKRGVTALSFNVFIRSAYNAPG